MQLPWKFVETWLRTTRIRTDYSLIHQIVMLCRASKDKDDKDIKVCKTEIFFITFILILLKQYNSQEEEQTET